MELVDERLYQRNAFSATVLLCSHMHSCQYLMYDVISFVKITIILRVSVAIMIGFFARMV